jgi:plastocyanin
MDRISTWKLYLGLGMVGFTLAANTLAGVRFVPQDNEPPLKPGESYAESRFGDAPAKVQVGSISGHGVSRSPAAEASSEDVPDSYSGDSLEGRAQREAYRREKNNPAFPDPMLETSPSAIARQGVQEVAIIAGDLGFFPKTIFLTRDVPVRFFVTGASKNTLCIIMDSFQVRKQVRPQKVEEISFTPHMPGKYRFYCPVNGMEGTMVVREFVSRLASE